MHSFIPQRKKCALCYALFAQLHIDNKRLQLDTIIIAVQNTNIKPNANNRTKSPTAKEVISSTLPNREKFSNKTTQTIFFKQRNAAITDNLQYEYFYCL